MSDNILRPIIDSLWVGLPFLWDKWGNLCYRLIEGRSFGTVVVSDDDIIETENISKYVYIPVEEMLNISKDRNTVKYSFVEGDKEGIKICIGKDMEGNLVVIDILDGNVLIGGLTGGGKSNLINVIITNIIRTYTKNEVCLFGSDLSEADVYYFRKYNNFVRMSSTEKGFLEHAKVIEDIIKDRKEILNNSNCINAIEYNKKNDKKMSYFIYVVDELVLLTKNEKCKNKLHELMCNSRKYGIFWILGGQDATKDTIGRCKMNCRQVIGFQTFDETDSNTLMGKGQNLNDISIPGRCKIRNSNGITETQIFYLERDEMEDILKPFEKETNTNI